MSNSVVRVDSALQEKCSLSGYAPAPPHRDTMDALLGALQGVRSRGPEQYAAHCPAHADKTPSLSITVRGEKILLHCWAGCSARAIVSAVGLSLADLFLDRPRAKGRRPAPPLRPPLPTRDAVAYRFDLAALDRRLRADRVLTAVRAVREPLDDAQRDHAMRLVATAYRDRDRATELEHLADMLRERAVAARNGGRHVA